MCQKALKKCTTQCRVHQLLDLFHHLDALFALLRVGCNTIKGKAAFISLSGRRHSQSFRLKSAYGEGDTIELSFVKTLQVTQPPLMFLIL